MRWSVDTVSLTMRWSVDTLCLTMRWSIDIYEQIEMPNIFSWLVCMGPEGFNLDF